MIKICQSTRMKLLLILNESTYGSHEDVHRALQELVLETFLEDYYIYPFLEKLNNGLNHKMIEKEITEISFSFSPTIILWSHTGNLKISKQTIKNLKELKSKPALGYWDGDIYQTFFKPLPKATLNLIKLCDVSFWQGYSETIKKLRLLGCKDMRYVPAPTDEYRFGGLRKGKIIYDVVMIGNYITSRLPWKTYPGSKLRKELADYFYKKLGECFAVFGAGWKGVYAKGPIPFIQQSKIYHSSRIALGVNNLHADYYFSNRLPICLSSGVIIIYNYERGMEEVFKEIAYPYLFNNKEEAWDMAQDLLSKPQEELDKIGLDIRNFALSNLSIKKILRYIISVLNDYYEVRQIKSVLTLKLNPWIKLSQF